MIKSNKEKSVNGQKSLQHSAYDAINIITSMERDLMGLNAKCKNADDTVAMTKRENESLKKEVTELKKTISDLKSEITALKTELDHSNVIIEED